MTASFSFNVATQLTGEGYQVLQVRLCHLVLLVLIHPPVLFPPLPLRSDV